MNVFKKYGERVAVAGLLGVITFAPSLVYAQSVKDGLQQVSQPFGTSSLSRADNIPLLIKDVIVILLGIAGAVAVLFVVFGGFQYMTAGGNEEQTKKGRGTIVNALIGIILIILAYAIVNVVVTFVSGGR